MLAFAHDGRVYFVSSSFVNEQFRSFIFNRSKNQLFCSFSKLLFIFHLFHSFSHWTFVQQNRLFSNTKLSFLKKFQKFVRSVKKLFFFLLNNTIIHDKIRSLTKTNSISRFVCSTWLYSQVEYLNYPNVYYPDHCQH